MAELTSFSNISTVLSFTMGESLTSDIICSSPICTGLWRHIGMKMDTFAPQAVSIVFIILNPKSTSQTTQFRSDIEVMDAIKNLIRYHLSNFSVISTQIARENTNSGKRPFQEWRKWPSMRSKAFICCLWIGRCTTSRYLAWTSWLTINSNRGLSKLIPILICRVAVHCWIVSSLTCYSNLWNCLWIWSIRLRVIIPTHANIWLRWSTWKTSNTSLYLTRKLMEKKLSNFVQLEKRQI